MKILLLFCGQTNFPTGFLTLQPANHHMCDISWWCRLPLSIVFLTASGTCKKVCRTRQKRLLVFGKPNSHSPLFNPSFRKPQIVAQLPFSSPLPLYKPYIYPFYIPMSPSNPVTTARPVHPLHCS